MRKPSKKVVLILIGVLGIWIIMSFLGLIPNFLGLEMFCPEERDLKPVIYLYPTQKTDVKIQLDYQGKIIADFPTYNSATKGWDVIDFSRWSFNQ